MTRDTQALESRRVAAVAEIAAGAGVSAVARKYGASRTSVFRWLKAAGDGGLAARKAPGRPQRVNREQLRTLYLDWCGPWSNRTFRDSIEEKFGVSYDVDHVSRLLKRLRRESV